jgi:ABC-type methionine transport system ATPase subunit
MSISPLFELKDVSFHVDDKDILAGITLNLHQGDFLAVLGASGAGKSTLLRMFNLLASPTSGNIYYRGQSLEVDVRTIRQNVGYLFQKPAIFNGSIKMNLLLAGRWDVNIANTLDHELKEILDQVELFDMPLGRNARDLSGGEQQRLALARVLLNNPQVLLLDEPTSSLDPKLSRAIMDLIKKLQAELNLTVIAVSHNHELMRRYASRVVLLHQGQIVASGSFNELDKMNALEDAGLLKAAN